MACPRRLHILSLDCFRAAHRRPARGGTSRVRSSIPSFARPAARPSMLSCTPLGARTRNRQHAPRAGRDLEADFQLYQGRVVEGADGLRALIVATRGRRVHIHNVGTARAAWWDVIERACKVEEGEGGGSTSTKHRARTTHMSMPAWHARSVPATLLPTPPLSLRAHETPTLRICRSGMPPTARHTTSLTHAYFEKSWSRCKAPSQV